MKGKPKPKPDEIELRPDGWERFEKAVEAAVKSGPKPKAPRKRGASQPAESRTRRE